MKDTNARLTWWFVCTTLQLLVAAFMCKALIDCGSVRSSCGSAQPAHLCQCSLRSVSPIRYPCHWVGWVSSLLATTLRPFLSSWLTLLVPVVLGHPWLSRHNPNINWCQNTVSSWSEFCHALCLLSACSSVSCSVLQDEHMDLSKVPTEYLYLKGVFSKSLAASLPPHRPYDCAIELVSGMSPPKGRLYLLSAPEREAMEKYISDSLAAKIIRPSSSEGAGFFFVEKKDGSLHPCIDYRGLNNITVKNTYPLPLMSSAFESLQVLPFSKSWIFVMPIIWFA